MVPKEPSWLFVCWSCRDKYTEVESRAPCVWLLLLEKVVWNPLSFDLFISSLLIFVVQNCMVLALDICRNPQNPTETNESPTRPLVTAPLNEHPPRPSPRREEESQKRRWRPQVVRAAGLEWRIWRSWSKIPTLYPKRPRFDRRKNEDPKPADPMCFLFDLWPLKKLTSKWQTAVVLFEPLLWRNGGFS